MYYSLGQSNSRPPADSNSLRLGLRASRPLYPREKDYVRNVFRDSVDLNKVRITRDHLFSHGATKTIGNTIHFQSVNGPYFNFEESPEQQLAQDGLGTLVHELVHVWQFQNGGWAYAPDSLAQQAFAVYQTGSRNGAYNWRQAFNKGLPWEKWGAEQQAMAIEDWHAALLAGDTALVQQLQPYVDKLRKGEGAPQISIAGLATVPVITAGIGYGLGGVAGARIGALGGILLNLPWNKWSR